MLKMQKRKLWGKEKKRYKYLYKKTVKHEGTYHHPVCSRYVRFHVLLQTLSTLVNQQDRNETILPVIISQLILNGILHFFPLTLYVWFNHSANLFNHKISASTSFHQLLITYNLETLDHLVYFALCNNYE